MFPSRASLVNPSVVDMPGWTSQIIIIWLDHALPPIFMDQGVPPLFIAMVKYYIRALAWSKASRFGLA
ncbi:hypothetical protein BJX65DRAFT_268458 [Aspergillus insuetus]